MATLRMAAAMPKATTVMPKPMAVPMAVPMPMVISTAMPLGVAEPMARSKAEAEPMEMLRRRQEVVLFQAKEKRSCE